MADKAPNIPISLSLSLFYPFLHLHQVDNYKFCIFFLLSNRRLFAITKCTVDQFIAIIGIRFKEVNCNSVSELSSNDKSHRSRVLDCWMAPEAKGLTVIFCPNGVHPGVSQLPSGANLYHRRVPSPSSFLPSRRLVTFLPITANYFRESLFNSNCFRFVIFVLSFISMGLPWVNFKYCCAKFVHSCVHFRLCS